MKKILWSLVFLGGIGYAQTVQDITSVPKYSSEINAGSARYLGMGGSMGALGSDISSAEQNPAGLAVAITSDANFSIGLNNYSNKAKFGETFKKTGNDFTVQSAGANIIFTNNTGDWNRFALGINVSQESLDNYIVMGRNDNIKATYLTNEDPEIYTTYIMNGYRDLTEGYKSKLSLDFSSSYKDKIFLGLGISVHDVNFSNYVIFEEDTDGKVYRYDLNGTPYNAKGSGVSLRVGTIAKVTDELRLGLAYHSPTWYNKVEENFYADLPVNDTDYEYDYYYNFYDRNSNGRLVASAGVVLAKSLALNADYTYHMNGSTKLKPSGYFSYINDFFNNNLKSSNEFRVGAEYRIDQFRIRAGYNFVESPFKSISLDSDFGSGNHSYQNISKAFVGDINRVSFGLGYDFGGFYLDAAYQFQNQTYNYIFGNGEYIDRDNNTTYLATLPLRAGYNYVSEIKKTNGLFVLTAGWQF